MSTVKKNFFYNGLLLLSNLLFPVVNFAYASRILGPAGIGKVQFVIVLATHFVVIAQLGIPVYGLQEVAKTKGNRTKLDHLFSELLFINILSNLFLAIVYLFLVFSIGWFRNSLNYYLLGSLLIFTGFSVLDWFYMGMEQFRFLSFRSIIIKIAALTALVCLVKTPGDLLLYFLIVIFSVLAGNLWNLVHLKGRVSVSFKKIRPSRHLKPLLILYASSLTISIYTLGDTLLLGFLTNDKVVGYYTAAKKLIILSIPLITSLGTVLIPRLAKSLDSNNKKESDIRVRQSFSFICLFGIPFSMGLVTFAPEIIRLFSGSQFTASILTLQLLSPVIFLVGLGHLFSLQLLIPAGYEKLYFRATILGMVVSLLLNFFLIPLLQDKGSAVAMLSAEAVVTFVSYYFVLKKLTIRVQWHLALKALLASLLFIPIRWLFMNLLLPYYIELFFAVTVSIMVYFTIQLFIFNEPLVRSLLNLFKTDKA